MSGEDPSDDLDIEAYAALQLELVAGDRAEVLAAHGLTEDAYDALDDRVQSALSRALDEGGDGVVPALVTRYDAALKRAREGAEAPLSFERFAEATVILKRGGDPTKALARIGVTLGDYFQSSGVWAARLSKDEELARRFAAIVG